jgi:2-iminobutanoate/2-iminopropanoate deaminase
MVGAMNRIVSTDRAPKAIGPYSQAVISGGFAFLCGLGPMDPATHRLVEGDIAVQAERVLENMKALLEAAGSSLSQVVKTTVFLKDMNDFRKMNEIYARYFPENPPARTTIEAARLPLDILVEIEAIASVG